MFTATLGNTSITINSFYRNTYVSEEGVQSTGTLGINGSVTALYDLVNTAINNFTIVKDGVTLYDTGNANIKITSIDESLNEENIYVNVNLRFN